MKDNCNHTSQNPYPAKPSSLSTIADRVKCDSKRQHLVTENHFDEKPCNAHAMSMRNSFGENILVIALAYADRSGGSSKLGLSFDLMAKKKLQIDGLYYLPIVKT